MKLPTPANGDQPMVIPRLRANEAISITFIYILECNASQVIACGEKLM